MKLVIILIQLFIYSLFSQETKYYYYDSDWKLVNSDYYTFYRIVNYSASGYIQSPIRDYYNNGSTQCVIYFDKIIPYCSEGILACGVENGSATWYNKDGSINHKSIYKNGKLIENEVPETKVLRFMKYFGVDILAKFAHPSSALVSSFCTQTGNTLYVNLYYKSSYYTKLSINYDNYFNGIKVIDDNDYMPPFFAASVIKNLALSYLTDSNEQNKNFFEKKIQKKFEDMEGEDYACMALTLEFLKF